MKFRDESVVTGVCGVSNSKLQLGLALCRDMHREECGADAKGLCDKMKPIDGERLLHYLRNVNFVGESVLHPY